MNGNFAKKKVSKVLCGRMAVVAFSVDYKVSKYHFQQHGLMQMRSFRLEPLIAGCRQMNIERERAHIENAPAI